MAKPARKWSKKVNIKEGALGALGWPDGGAIAAKIRSGSVPYATAIRRLGFIANVSGGKNAKTAMKARAIMARLKREFRPEGKKVKGK